MANACDEYNLEKLKGLMLNAKLAPNMRIEADSK